LKSIPVFFTPKQVHDPVSYSKSPLKPAQLARRVSEQSDFRMMPPEMISPVEPERLMQIHTRRYVDGVVAGDLEDGFGNRSAKDNRAIRTTVGNFLLAAEWAVGGRGEGGEADIIHPGVVWSLTSGFHHACPDGGEGFCTFEALTLAAFELQKFHNVRTLIVDEDAHYGNGCAAMIQKHRMGSYCRYLQSRHTHGEPDLDGYRDGLVSNLTLFEPDLIIYQAGADNWDRDPLGGWLSKSELYQRDLITFEVARRVGIPVVCNLAGGYAENYEDTLEIHMNTGRAMREVYLG
jgi:acetoin utilization deacetylase AcuC-like enzyme